MYVKSQDSSEKNKEHYIQPTLVAQEKEKQVEQLSTPVLILFFIIQLFFGMIAFQLSWHSNSKAGWSNGYKILFGIIAFMCPFTYISIHILFKLDLLSQIKNKKSLNKY